MKLHRADLDCMFHASGIRCFNPFVPISCHKVFRCFQGVEKKFTGNKCHEPIIKKIVVKTSENAKRKVCVGVVFYIN